GLGLVLGARRAADQLLTRELHLEPPEAGGRLLVERSPGAGGAMAARDHQALLRRCRTTSRSMTRVSHVRNVTRPAAAMALASSSRSGGSQKLVFTASGGSGWYVLIS